ncbi:MAG: HD domain-containing protein [Desulfamplus sp.]|nr:HD domain-containing protein [Desulfamplus sp.]
MINSRASIDKLIDIVRQGGKVKTGIDIYNSKGVLLLEKDIVVNRVKTLEIIKDEGFAYLPLNSDNYGGIWDSEGNHIQLDELDDPKAKPSSSPSSMDQGDNDRGSSLKDETGTSRPGGTRIGGTRIGGIEKRLKEIDAFKRMAAEKYAMSKKQAQKVLEDIKSSGGHFDYEAVEQNMTQMVDFFKVSENPFSYLNRDLFRYDDYLVSHCINVCAIGSAMLNRFNTSFSSSVNRYIATAFPENVSPAPQSAPKKSQGSYQCYLKDDIQDITVGFFLHDIGKVMIPESVLYKKGKLTAMEFDMIRKHSYQMGTAIIEKNRISNSVVRNIVKYHHAALFDGEKRCYPGDLPPSEIPLYVKMCKLADIYDAMISKQCYKEAYNPINAVTDIFRKYAKKDHMLQFILHAFVKSIGIYPTGSIIYLMNGQMAYVLESSGPLVLPFTDRTGITLTSASEPIDLGDKKLDQNLKADSFRSIQTPVEVHDRLPAYLKSAVTEESSL